MQYLHSYGLGIHGRCVVCNQLVPTGTMSKHVHPGHERSVFDENGRYKHDWSTVPSYTIPEEDSDLWQCGKRLTGPACTWPYRGKPTLPPWNSIEERQRKAVSLFADGHSYSAIAKQIGRTPAGRRQFGNDPISRERVRQLIMKTMLPMMRCVPRGVYEDLYTPIAQLRKMAAWWRDQYVQKN